MRLEATATNKPSALLQHSAPLYAPLRLLVRTAAAACRRAPLLLRSAVLHSCCAYAGPTFTFAAAILQPQPQPRPRLLQASPSAASPSAAALAALGLSAWL